MKTKFELQKENALGKLNKALEEGLVDEVMVPILSDINSRETYYTTSSCAGRITLFQDVGSRYDNDFLARWHSPPETNEVLEKVADIAKKPPAGIVWFRQEPAILHVVSPDLEGAVRILNIALRCGFKRSGIQVLKPGRFMVELCGTERLDVPVMQNGKLLVGYDYIEMFADELKGL
ncbi:MAG: hypothetical protein A7315_14810 [Candidatus Altiarchaeales archaeon WOR_SM1_79]|nr:MAG: hypothetical protein A7315_14810 [Candidatus Altiarchaeales archaeon WOR_SM1_79]